MGAEKNEYHYATVVEAIDQLRSKGFTLDFNLEENCISCLQGKFSHEEFEVAEVYRYEGNTDPADEATVYGIESNGGLRGILVTGAGSEIDARSQEILKKLHY
jgi:hypothetical protein